MKVDLFSTLDACPEGCGDVVFECEAVELPADGCELAGGLRLRVVVDCAHSGVCGKRTEAICASVDGGVVPL